MGSNLLQQKQLKKKLTHQTLKSGIEAAHAAGEVLLRYYKKRNFRVREKYQAGLVTDADFEAQEKSVKILKKAFPEFGFLTEEAAPEIREHPGRWIIDPLDGTTNFVHGFPMFCVSIAAEWHGEIIAGIIHHPILGETYRATLGGGAFVNRTRLRVSQTRQLSDSLLTTGFNYGKGNLLHAEIETFENLSQEVRAVRRPGSAALDLAYTARGVFDGFWERRLAPWDVAAGYLLVLEAGGKVTDFQGNPFRLDSVELMASNGKLHSKLIESLDNRRM